MNPRFIRFITRFLSLFSIFVYLVYLIAAPTLHGILALLVMVSNFVRSFASKD